MDFRFVAYDPQTGAKLYQLPRANSVKIGDTFGTRGTLELTYSAKAINARSLPTFLEVQAEVTFDQGHTWAPAGPSLLRLSGSHEGTDQAGMRTLQFVGREWILTKARVGNGDLPLIDGKRPFYRATPGEILRTLILEAQDRGAANGIQIGNFTGSKDSAGKAWSKVATIYYGPGLPIASVLENLVEQGMCDYRMEGRTLHLYDPETVMGRDLTTGDNPVRVHGAVTEAPVKYTLEDLANSALLIGDEGFELEVDNPSAPDDYGRLEVTIEQGGVSDAGTARIMVDESLQRGSREIREITRSQSAAGAAALPFRDYRVGDYVQVRDSGAWERYRVREVQLDRDGDEWTIHTIINDRLQELLLKLAKRTNGIVNGSKGSGGDGTRPAPPAQPGIEPAAPEGLVVDQQVYLDRQGVARGQVTAGWGEVTESTKGTAVEIGGYELWWRENETLAVWRRASSVVDSLSVSHSPVVLTDTLGNAMEYQWRVRAIAEASARPGPFSNVVTLTMTQDTTPPNMPSLPLVETDLRIITVTVDGLDEFGEAMPVDFDHNRIYFATAENMSDAVQVGALTQPGSWNSGSMAPDVPVWVAVSAVDHVGNESVITPAQTVTPKQLVDDDSIRGELDGIDDAIADAVTDLNTRIDNIVIDANGITTYQTPYMPDETTDPPPKRGDLWFDTSVDGNNTLHRFDGQGWVSAADERIDTIGQAQDKLEGDLDEVRTSANGKNSVHYSARHPVESDPGTEGDVWWVGQSQFGRYQTLLIGDSITEGTGTTNAANRWQTLIQKRLNPSGPDFPFIPGWPNSPAPGFPVARGGAVRRSNAWATRTGLGWRTAEIYREAEGASAGWVEFTFTGTSAEVMFTSNNLTGTALISVDGAAPVEFETNSVDRGETDDLGLTWSTGPLEDGDHLIRVTRGERVNPGAYDSVWVQGAFAYRGDESTGARLLDGARHAIRSTWWTDDTDRLPMLFGDRGSLAGAGGAAHIAYLVGTNDYSGSVPVADFKANTQMVIDEARAGGFDGTFLLVGMYLGRGRDASLWAEYIDQLKAISDADPMVDFFDLRGVVPGPDEDPSLFADHVHPNDAGSLVIADALESRLTPLGGKSWNVIAQYVHDGTAWQETALENHVIASLDAAKIVSGFIDSARIKAGSITADKVLIGDGGNLVPTDLFDAWEGANSAGGGVADPSPIVAQENGGPGGLPSMAVTDTDGQLGGYIGLNPGEYRIPVEPGARYMTRARFKSSVDAPANTISTYVRVYSKGAAADSWAWADGGRGNNAATPAGEWGVVEGVVQIPDDCSEAALGLFKQSALGSGEVIFSRPEFVSTVAGTLIEDGAVTTDKIAAGAITAESGVIESLDAGKITFGEMDGARIAAGTVTADKLLIGMAGDYVPNGTFSEGMAAWSASPPGELVLGAGENGSNAVVFAVESSGTYGLNSSSWPVPGPGKVRVSARVKADQATTATGQVNIYLRSVDKDGGLAYSRFELPPLPADEWTTVSAQLDVSDVAVECNAQVSVRSSFPAGNTLYVSSVSARDAVGQTLIEDGAITTDKILANAITAGKIAALAIEADHISANAITADKINAGAIDGKLITGARIRTSASGARVELNSEGLKAYRSNGAVVLSTDTSDGSLDMLGNLTQTRMGITFEVGRNYRGAGPGIQWSDSNTYAFPPGVVYSKDFDAGAEMQTLIQGPGVTEGNSYLELRERGNSFHLSTWKGTGNNRDRWKVEGNLAENYMRVGSADSPGPYIVMRRGAAADNGSLYLRYSHPNNTGYSSIDLGDSSAGMWAYNWQGTRMGSLTMDASGSRLDAGTRDLYLYGADVVLNPTNDLYMPGLPPGSSAVPIGRDGYVCYISSSRKSKLIEEPLESTVESFEDRLLSVDAKTWVDRRRAEMIADQQTAIANGEDHEELPEGMGGLERIPGVVAEDMIDAGLELFVHFDESGDPMAVMYDRIGPALIPIIRRLRDRVDALEMKLGENNAA